MVREPDIRDVPDSHANNQPPQLIEEEEKDELYVEMQN